MKCIEVSKFGPPEVLTLTDVPDPQPVAGQVVVDLHAVGVNPVDTYIRSGIYGERPMPYIPGSDAAGTIGALGEGVTDWKVGDRVYLAGSQSGTYAEKALCGADQVHPLPDGIDFKQGAALYVPYSTAYRALFQRGQAEPGEWVFIHGASGGVGLAAVQWGRARGLRIIGTAGSPEGLEMVRRQGADHALDHHTSDYLEEARQLSGGGPALILEMLANVNLQKDLDLLAKYGRIIVIGNRGSLDFNARAAMGKEADVRGMSLFNTPPDRLAQIQKAIVAGLQAGFLKPVVSREFPLSQAARAHEAVLEPGALGKIVLLPFNA